MSTSSWNIWYQRPHECDDEHGNNDNLDSGENDEDADHEDNYSSGVIWDGSADVFQRSRESEWFFFHPLDPLAVMTIRIMIMIVMIDDDDGCEDCENKRWWMDQK